MKKSKGYTLIELMIVVAIIGTVIIVIPKILRSVTQFQRMNTARIETQKAARGALSLINKSLRQASAATLVISAETNQPPCSSMQFNTVDGRTMKFFQEDNELKYVTASSTKTLAENLRYIAFTTPRTDDPDIVSVSVTFEKSTYEGGSKALQMAIEKVRIMND